MEAGFSLLSLWLVVAEEAGLHRRIRCGAVSEAPPPFRLAERATHQHARARRQRSRQAVSREGGRAKRNPGLARARRLLRPALFVTASEFHGVPFGLVPAGLFRYGVGPVMAWLFRFCKRPNGMEVGVFVAFVVAGARAVIIWRPYCGSAGHPCQQRRCLSFDSFDVNTLRRL